MLILISETVLLYSPRILGVLSDNLNGYAPPYQRQFFLSLRNTPPVFRLEVVNDAFSVFVYADNSNRVVHSSLNNQVCLFRQFQCEDTIDRQSLYIQNPTLSKANPPIKIIYNSWGIVRLPAKQL